MSQKNKNEKSQLCWNCEGRVPLGAEDCSHCGVAMPQLSLIGQGLYPPSYAGGGGAGNSGSNGELLRSPDQRSPEQRSPEQQGLPPSPFQRALHPEESLEDREEPREEASEESSERVGAVAPTSQVALSFLLLNGGTLLLLFALALLLFSENSLLTLQWRADYWFYYLTGGLFCLVFGWLRLTKSS